MQNFVERTGDNALLLTAFALAFSPVSPLSGKTGDKIKTGEKTHEQAFCTARVLSPRKKRHERKMLMCCEAVKRVGILRILSTIVIFLFLIVESLP